MKRILIITLFLFRAALTLYGSGREEVYDNKSRFTYTIEWGLSGNLFNYNVSTYITDVQSLVHLRNIDPFFHINGELFAGAGLNAGRRWNFSVLAGYCGIQKNLRFFPIELRTTFFLSPDQRQGVYLFLGGGGGYCEKKEHKTAFFCKTGCGHRFDIGSGAALDFKVSLQGAYSHPDVVDKYNGKIVTPSNLRQSKSLSINTIFSVALVF